MSIKLTYSTAIDCGCLGELDAKITFIYTPAERATMYRSNGDPGDPGCPSEVEVLSLTWPYDSSYLSATWDHLLDHTQEELIEELEAFALECITEGDVDDRIDEYKERFHD
jgi:hypothetical protein